MGKKAHTIDAPRTTTQDKALFCLPESTYNFLKHVGFSSTRLQDTLTKKINQRGTGRVVRDYERELYPQPAFVKKMRGTKCCLWILYIKIRNEERRHQTASRLWMNDDVPIQGGSL